MVEGSSGHHNKRVSRYFTVGGLCLWNPSNRVADLFLRTGEAVAVVASRPTGLGPMIADEHEIDRDAFVAFVEALTGRYLSSSHVVLRSLLEGFLATAIVLVDRSGGEVATLRTTAGLDLMDVSVGAGGICALGSRDRLVLLAGEHALSMPR